MRSLLATALVGLLGSAAAAAPKASIRDGETKKRLLAASALTMDERGYFGNDQASVAVLNPFTGYVNSCTEAIAETCLAMYGDAEPRVRSLAASCVQACSTLVLDTPALYDLTVAVTLDGLERETHAGVALQQTYAVASVGEGKAPAARTVARIAKVTTRLAGGAAVQRESAKHLLDFLGRQPGPVAPAIEELVLSLLRDGRRDLLASALGLADQIADQRGVCKAVAPQLRADAPAWFEVAAFLLGHPPSVAACDDLLDPAIDLVLAQGVVNVEALIVFEDLDQKRALPAATRKRIASGLRAARGKARTGDRAIYDHLIQTYARPRRLTGK